MASERDYPAIYGQVPQASPSPMETHQFQRPARNDSFDSLNVSPMEGNQPAPDDPSSSSSTVNDPTLTHTQQTQTAKLLDPTPRSFPSTLRIWWPEILTCVVILGMFGAVVGTIQPYQGKPLPIWPYHLQINTVVSIYFTIIKACMVFILAEGLGQLKWGWFSSGQTRPLYHLAAYDNATRGPWGSFNLLWKLRCRTFLPSIAALAIVLATIVDPFGQQIIRFYPCQIQASQPNGDNLAATVTRNRFVDGGFPGGGLSASDTDVIGGWALSGEMQDAILGGIYSSPKSVDPDFETALLEAIKPFCPTGNCTFSVPYVSAGWCSKCDDLTSQVKVVDVPDTNITIPYAGGWNDTLPAHKNATLVYRAEFPSSDPPYPKTDSSDSSSGGGSFGPTFGKRQGQSDFGPTFGSGGGSSSDDAPPPGDFGPTFGDSINNSGGDGSSGSSSNDTPPDDFGPTFGDNGGGGSSSNDTPIPTSTPEIDPNSSNDTPFVDQPADYIDPLTTVRLSAALTDPPILQFSSIHSQPNSFSPSSQIILLLGSDGPRDAAPETPTYYTPGAFLRNKFSAASCSLSPCVRKYNASVTNGLMTETVLSQSSDWGSAARATYQSSCWSILDISCLNSTEKSSLRKINYTFTDSDHFLKYHYSGWTYPDIEKADDSWMFPNGDNDIYHEQKPYLSSRDIRDECVYQVCTPTMNAIQSGIDRIFWDQWAGFNPWVSTTVARNGAMDGPSHLQSIYQNGNLSLKSLERIFESVANRMTLVNRRSGRQYVQQQTGEVWAQSTCVDVRWWWIIYPGVLALVTVGFLVGTILTGRGVFGRPMKTVGGEANAGGVMRLGYKNGILPLVLAGVVERKDPLARGETGLGRGHGGAAVSSTTDIAAVEAGTAGGIAERTGEIEDLSKKMEVRLDRTDAGWRFKEV